MNKGISAKSLNEAMRRSNQRAIRTNKALGLDTVYVEGNRIIREDADGRTSTIRILGESLSSTKKVIQPLKIG